MNNLLPITTQSALKVLLSVFLMTTLFSVSYGQAETETSSLEKAKEFEKQKDYRSALYWYKKANTFNPQNAMTLYYMAWCHNELSEHESAISAAEKGIAILASEKLYNELAFAHYSLKNYIKAAEYYMLALTKNPESKVAAKGIANCYYNRDVYDSAAHFYKLRVKLDDKDADSYFRLSWIMNEYRDFNRAAEYASKATALNSKNAAAFNEWGFALSKLNKKDQALQKFQTASQLNPSSTEYLFNIANMYFEEGPQKNHDKAIQYYKKVLEQNTTNELVYYRLGWLYNEKKNFKLALSYLKNVLENNPSYADAWVESGWANLSLNKLAEAESDLTNALLLNNKSELARYYLGQTYIALGKKQNAAQMLQELKKMNSPYEKKLKSVMSFN